MSNKDETHQDTKVKTKIKTQQESNINEPKEETKQQTKHQYYSQNDIRQLADTFTCELNDMGELLNPHAYLGAPPNRKFVALPTKLGTELFGSVKYGELMQEAQRSLLSWHLQDRMRNATLEQLRLYWMDVHLTDRFIANENAGTNQQEWMSGDWQQ